MSAAFITRETLQQVEDAESHRSQLWKETERDGDHQAQNKRNTYVTERSDQQRSPLEKSCSEKETVCGEIQQVFKVNETTFKVTDLCKTQTSRLGTAAVVPNSAARDNAVSLTA